MSIAQFHLLIAEWFTSSVGTPIDVQVQAWPAMQSRVDVLIAAPTGRAAIYPTPQSQRLISIVPSCDSYTLPERPVCVPWVAVHELTRSGESFLAQPDLTSYNLPMVNWRRFRPADFECDFDADKLAAHRVTFEEAVECFFSAFECDETNLIRIGSN